MKKITFFLVVLLTGLVSCEGPMGPPGRDGVANKVEYIFTIYPDEWKFEDDGQYGAHCWVSKPLPKLTDAVYFDKQFLIYGYLIRNFDQKDEYQTLLPFDTYDRDKYTGNFYSETYAFDTTPGYIYFNIAPSDFKLERPSGNIVFRVILLW